MKRIIPFLLLGSVLAACNEKQVEPETEEGSSVAWTKTMVFAVDLNSVFHEDLNDEDFSDVGPITEQLLNDVISGKLTAYDPFSEEAMSTDQAKSLLMFTDTIWFINPETGDQSIDIVERDYTTEFYGLTFKEKWSYDAEGSVLSRKIVGLAPRIPVYSKQGGELRGYTSAFWVKYDN